MATSSATTAITKAPPATPPLDFAGAAGRGVAGAALAGAAAGAAAVLEAAVLGAGVLEAGVLVGGLLELMEVVELDS